MTDRLSALEGCKVYIDDILVHGEDMDEHNRRLDAVLAHLKKIGAKLNKSKCKFAETNLLYLGHCLSAHGISADKAKISEALSLNSPSTVAETRRVLGMLNYLQKFLPDLSSHVKSIRDILKGEFDAEAVEHCWTDIKDALHQAADLSFSFYDSKAQTAVLSDASPYGLGAVLLQHLEGDWKPVLTASRSLTATEQKYTQMERELLSIVFAADRFRQFILGGHVKFASIFDHSKRFGQNRLMISHRVFSA